ncbi:hypothetical protein HNO88_004438 [Novosphingobium chloroacetimidivorans]|uniref:Transposase n=1 Tax=Novosphingobium chloroacetimidivorans TaxID=1428314 RepID=A0A7W7KF35_9SPHN|nr:hypothetical protein [Novosphingobium chloroacetimidivorans]MBB4861084.1 hypothetical protein [Novosphingobium chloroacetimidivorans]
MTVAILGIDVAKNIFRLHGEDPECTTVLQPRVRRDRLMEDGRWKMEDVAVLPPCVIAIEACTGAFTGSAGLKKSGTRCGSSRPNMSSHSLVARRTTPTKQLPSAGHWGNRA